MNGEAYFEGPYKRCYPRFQLELYLNQKIDVRVISFTLQRQKTEKYGVNIKGCMSL